MKFFLLLTGFLTLCGVASECPPTTFSNVNDDKCYYGIATSNGFDDASAFCAVQLGYLASVANAFENAALLADMQLTLGPNGQAWMGGKLGSDWGWTDGEDMSYTNWKPGQPGSGGCMMMDLSSGQWVSADCGALAPFICEMETFDDDDQFCCPECECVACEPSLELVCCTSEDYACCGCCPIDDPECCLDGACCVEHPAEGCAGDKKQLFYNITKTKNHKHAKHGSMKKMNRQLKKKPFKQ